MCGLERAVDGRFRLSVAILLEKLGESVEGGPGDVVAEIQALLVILGCKAVAQSGADELAVAKGDELHGNEMAQNALW